MTLFTDAYNISAKDYIRHYSELCEHEYGADLIDEFDIESLSQSFENQTFQDFEIIVVDDASRDNTQGVVTSFNDRRIKWAALVLQNLQVIKLQQ